MDIQEVCDLVLEGERDLRNIGGVRANWWSDYASAIESSATTFSASVWPKQLFAAFHFSSTHLGLRYRLWKDTEKKVNTQTESMLYELQYMTDQFFWSSLLKIPHWRASGMLPDAERRLIELCFGASSPVAQEESDYSPELWRDEYESCLRDVEHGCKLKEYWSKWFCVAVHFAGFYIDLIQVRTVDLNMSLPVNAEHLPVIGHTVAELHSAIENERVLHLVELWLRCAGMNRDASGLPELGQLRSRSERFISVRTSSELFLQICAGTA